MLDNETNADSGSIRWIDNEDAFVILDQNKFEKVCVELIPIDLRSASLSMPLTLHRSLFVELFL